MDRAQRFRGKLERDLLIEPLVKFNRELPCELASVCGEGSIELSILPDKKPPLGRRKPIEMVKKHGLIDKKRRDFTIWGRMTSDPISEIGNGVRNEKANENLPKIRGVEFYLSLQKGPSE